MVIGLAGTEGIDAVLETKYQGSISVGAQVESTESR